MLHRLSRRGILLGLAMIWCASDSLAFPGNNSAAKASGCTDLNAAMPPVAPFTQFNFQLNIAGLFQVKCANCHVNGTNTGSGALNLDFINAYGNLINVPSAQDPNLIRVIPGNSGNSLLFQKVNCAIQDVGEPMPLGGDNLSIAQQRIIKDWIDAGAPLMKGGFEDR